MMPPKRPPRLPSSSKAFPTNSNWHDYNKTKWIVVAFLILLAITLLMMFLAAVQVMNSNASASKNQDLKSSNSPSRSSEQHSKLSSTRSKQEEPSAIDSEPKTSSNPSPEEKDQATEFDSATLPEGDKNGTGNAVAEQGANSGDFHVIQRAGFFGIAAKGRKIVYVVDRSGSMQGVPLTRAKQEVLRSVSELKEGQSFQVILFDEQMYQFSTTNTLGLVEVNAENLDALKKWLELFEDGGGTEPMQSIATALAMDPDVIYLLTDGQFDGQVAVKTRAANKNDTQINTIAFISNSGEAVLKTIAEQNDGNYLFVK